MLSRQRCRKIAYEIRLVKTITMESSKIKFVPYCPKTPLPGWKCPKRFKLGLGFPWESSDNEEDSETEMDELLLMASQRYEAELDKQNGSVNTCKSDWTPRRLC